MRKKIVAGCCLTLLCMSAAGWASPSASARRLVFTTSVPFEFVAGNRTLPAGIYTFEIVSGAPAAGEQVAVLIIRNSEQYSYVAVVTDVALELGEQTDSRAVFQRIAGRTFLAQVWQEEKPFRLRLPYTQASVESAQSAAPETITLLTTAVAAPTSRISHRD